MNNLLNLYDDTQFRFNIDTEGFRLILVEVFIILAVFVGLWSVWRINGYNDNVNLVLIKSLG